jgi:predicted nucleic acid-binding protein
MAVLIDTSVLIDAERGGSLDDLIARYGDEEVAISAVTASELLHGVHRVRGGARAARAESFVEALLELVAVLPFDLSEARVHARLSAELQTKGTRIGAHDLLIAATAIAHDAPVVTRDLRSFPRIQGLDVVRR